MWEIGCRAGYGSPFEIEPGTRNPTRDHGFYMRCAMTDARDLVRDLVRDDVFDLVRCVQCGGHGMAYGLRAHMMDPVRYPGPGE